MNRINYALKLILSFVIAIAPLKPWAEVSAGDLKAIGESYRKMTGENPDAIKVTSQEINGVTIYHATISRCDRNNVCTEVHSAKYRENYGLILIDGQYITVKTIDRYKDDRVITSAPTQRPRPPRLQDIKRIDYIAGSTNVASQNSTNDFQNNIQMRVMPPPELRSEIQQALPSVVSAMANSYQDLQKAIQTSRALHEAYKNNLNSLSNFTKVLENQRQQLEKSSNINDSMTTAFLSMMSSQVSTSSISLEQGEELNKFEEVKQDPFTFRQYELTELAAKDLNQSTDTAIAKKNVRLLAKNSEIALGQIEDRKRNEFATRYRSVIHDGLVQVGALNPRAGPSPLDKRTFKVDLQTPAGQSLRRIGNFAQTLWSEQEGFQYATDQSKAAYVAGLVNLSSAESSFLEEDYSQGFTELVTANKFLQASVGFTKGLYAAGKDNVMAYPMMIKAVASLSSALVEDPASVVERAADLIVNTPQIATAILNATKAYGEDFINGDAEIRGEILGRVTGEVVINFFSGGTTRVIRSIKDIEKIESTVSRINQLIKPSSAFGEAIVQKASQLEPHVSDAFDIIQRSTPPGTNYTNKLDKITQAYAEVKTFNVTLLPEVVKHRHILTEIRNGYNIEVSKIANYDKTARAAGESLETIARNCNEMRRSAGNFYKNKTPEIIRNEIYGRNLFIYGDELGPSFDVMVKDGLANGIQLTEAYENIIRTSQRTNNSLNKFLDLLARELP